MISRVLSTTRTAQSWPPELAGGAHRLDGQLTVVLDVDRVLEIMPKAALAA
jgi:hypothetical protein